MSFEIFTHQLATAAGQAILPFFRSKMSIENKGVKTPFDPVTQADKAAERAMRDLINAHFPAHGIIGEEYGQEKADADHVWVLDPIDGTKGFMCGLHTWATLIGLTHKGNPTYGMMHQPFTQESFYGDGKVAHSKTSQGIKQLKARECESLSNAVLSLTSPHNFNEKDYACYKKVENQVKLARFGTDCYAYAMLAAGHVDLVVEAGLDSYDIVALIPVIEGAGGIITTWEGKPATKGGRIIAAGDRRVYDEAMKLLNFN